MLCNPTDSSLPGSSVHGIFQARILGWVAISFCRGSSHTQISCIGGRILYHCTTQESMWSCGNACRRIKCGWQFKQLSASRFAKGACEKKNLVFLGSFCAKDGIQTSACQPNHEVMCGPTKAIKSCLRLWLIHSCKLQQWDEQAHGQTTWLCKHQIITWTSREKAFMLC